MLVFLKGVSHSRTGAVGCAPHWCINDLTPMVERVIVGPRFLQSAFGGILRKRSKTERQVAVC